MGSGSWHTPSCQFIKLMGKPTGTVILGTDLGESKGRREREGGREGRAVGLGWPGSEAGWPQTPHLIMGVGRTPQMLAAVSLLFDLDQFLLLSGSKCLTCNVTDGTLSAGVTEIRALVPAVASFWPHDFGRVS